MGRIARVLVAAAVACLGLAPGASASGEIADPCGLGAAIVDASNELEPQIPWLDVCSVDVSGVTGEGPLRAVRSVLQLDGDVGSGARAGAGYSASFRTGHCSVWQEYKIYPGLEQETGTTVQAYCDYRREPCPWPESEIPNIKCGESDSFWLTDSPALSGAVAGNSVTISFDPNQLPADSMLAGLATDLAPGGTLTNAWAQTLLHNGVRGVTSSSIGPGGDFAWGTTPVPLGGGE